MTIETRIGGEQVVNVIPFVSPIAGKEGFQIRSNALVEGTAVGVHDLVHILREAGGGRNLVQDLADLDKDMCLGILESLDPGGAHMGPSLLARLRGVSQRLSRGLDSAKTAQQRIALISHAVWQLPTEEDGAIIPQAVTLLALSLVARDNLALNGIENQDSAAAVIAAATAKNSKKPVIMALARVGPAPKKTSNAIGIAERVEEPAVEPTPETRPAASRRQRRPGFLTKAFFVVNAAILAACAGSRKGPEATASSENGSNSQDQSQVETNEPETVEEIEINPADYEESEAVATATAIATSPATSTQVEGYAFPTEPNHSVDLEEIAAASENASSFVEGYKAMLEGQLAVNGNANNGFASVEARDQAIAEHLRQAEQLVRSWANNPDVNVEKVLAENGLAVIPVFSGSYSQEMGGYQVMNMLVATNGDGDIAGVWWPEGSDGQKNARADLVNVLDEGASVSFEFVRLPAGAMVEWQNGLPYIIAEGDTQVWYNAESGLYIILPSQGDINPEAVKEMLPNLSWYNTDAQGNLLGVFDSDTGEYQEAVDNFVMKGGHILVWLPGEARFQDQGAFSISNAMLPASMFNPEVPVEEQAFPDGIHLVAGVEENTYGVVDSNGNTLFEFVKSTQQGTNGEEIVTLVMRPIEQEPAPVIPEGPFGYENLTQEQLADIVENSQRLYQSNGNEINLSWVTINDQGDDNTFMSVSPIVIDEPHVIRLDTRNLLDTTDITLYPFVVPIILEDTMGRYVVVEAVIGPEGIRASSKTFIDHIQTPSGSHNAVDLVDLIPRISANTQHELIFYTYSEDQLDYVREEVAEAEQGPIKELQDKITGPIVEEFSDITEAFFRGWTDGSINADNLDQWMEENGIEGPMLRLGFASGININEAEEMNEVE